MTPLRLRSFVLTAAGILVAGAALAQEPAALPAPAPAPSMTKLTLDLGFVNSAGNTRVTTLSFAEELSVKPKRWEFRETGSTVYGRNGDSTTAEQLKVDGRVEFQLVSVVHAFVGGIYERNRFAGIQRRFEEYGGLAIKFIDRPSDLLTLEVGSSLNQDRTTAVTNNDRNYAALRGALLFRHNFTKTAYFQQTVEGLPNLSTSADWRLNSETALVAPIAGRAAIKVSYVVKYDNQTEQVPNQAPGVLFLKSDRILTTTLQIVF